MGLLKNIKQTILDLEHTQSNKLSNTSETSTKKKATNKEQQKSARKITRSSARAKGKRFEIEIKEYFIELYHRLRPSLATTIRRGLQGNGGQQESDVVTPDFWVECKFYGTDPNPRHALEQATADCDKHVKLTGQTRKIPCAVTKANRRQPIISFFLCDFIHVMDAGKRYGK
jgi:hypothetical protein